MDSLLRRLTTLDFMTTDIGLYINTHPNDEDAIKTYNEFVTEAKAVREEYENKNGPLVPSRSYIKSANIKGLNFFPWRKI
ncbi:hypothetical protein AGMMS49975_04800 [Clostridia bacterium]|nr:hypothetical protein AGMMS49975_04800 [Clostridia bacterium]